MCLPMIRKILTEYIWEECYYLLVNRRQFPETQKGCHKRRRGTGDLLLVMRYIYFKEAYILRDKKVNQD